MNIISRIADVVEFFAVREYRCDVTIPGVLGACYVLVRVFGFPSEAYWVKVDDTEDSLRTKPHHELNAEHSESPSFSQRDVWLIKKYSRASGCRDTTSSNRPWEAVHLNHTLPLLCTELSNGSKVRRFYFPMPKVSKFHFVGNGTIQIWRQGVSMNLWNAARASLVRSDHVISITSSSIKAPALIHYITATPQKGTLVK